MVCSIQWMTVLVFMLRLCHYFHYQDNAALWEELLMITCYLLVSSVELLLTSISTCPQFFYLLLCLVFMANTWRSVKYLCLLSALGRVLVMVVKSRLHVHKIFFVDEESAEGNEWMYRCVLYKYLYVDTGRLINAWCRSVRIYVKLHELNTVNKLQAPVSC